MNPRRATQLFLHCKKWFKIISIKNWSEGNLYRAPPPAQEKSNSFTLSHALFLQCDIYLTNLRLNWRPTRLEEKNTSKLCPCSARCHGHRGGPFHHSKRSAIRRSLRGRGKSCYFFWKGVIFYDVFVLRTYSTSVTIRTYTQKRYMIRYKIKRTTFLKRKKMD